MVVYSKSRLVAVVNGSIYYRMSRLLSRLFSIEKLEKWFQSVDILLDIIFGM